MGDQTDFVQEEPLDLECLTMIVSTCVVQDVSILSCPSFEIACPYRLINMLSFHFPIFGRSVSLDLDSILGCTSPTQLEVVRKSATSFDTNLLRRFPEAFQLFLTEFDPILYRSLERRHSASKY